MAPALLLPVGQVCAAVRRWHAGRLPTAVMPPLPAPAALQADQPAPQGRCADGGCAGLQDAQLPGA